MKKMSLSLLLLVLSTCSTQLKTINLSYVQTPLNAPIILNVYNQFFQNAMQEKNIHVKFTTLYNGSQQVAALAAKEVDIVPTMGSTSAIVGLANNAPLKIVGMFGRSPGAFTLATTDTNYDSIQSLRGKKIGGPKGTVLHQLLLKLLEVNNLSTNDIEFISLGVQEALPALLAGEIDGALLVGPASIMAEKKGARIIHTGEGYIDGSTLIVTRDDFVNKYPDIIKQYLDTQQQSIEYMNANPMETSSILAEHLKLSTQDIDKALPTYTFKTNISETDIKNLNETQDFLYKEGLIPKKIDITKSIYQI